jgi:triacylglycerol lipase
MADSALESSRQTGVGPNLYITGHSLGGALATLCALSMKDRKPSVVTFSSPRVGDIQFSANFNKLIPDCVRVFNTEDIVPQVTFATVDIASGGLVYGAVDRFLRTIGANPYCHLGKALCCTYNLGHITSNHIIGNLAQHLS